jgi:nucleotide-binding universal stress UspA family protein
MTSVMFQPEVNPAEVAMSGKGEMKSVLLHVQDDKGLEARLQTALAIVRASSGHLTCMHATPMSNYIGYETYGGAFVLSELLNQLDEQDAAMRARIESQLAKEDVSWSYDRQTMDPASALIHWGALADLIVLGRDESIPRSAYQPISILGDILAVTHSPVLVCSQDQPQFDPFGTAVVAWNDSFEAANALRAALPLLKQASSVHIVTVDEDRELDFPPLGPCEYLSRHGVHAEIISEAKGTLTISDRLVASARSLGASYLVMGAYGHHRVREYLFGGVTRSLLLECPMPLLLAR